MKRQYRLTPKPGVARSNKIIRTSSKPVIVPGQKNIIRTSSNNPPRKDPRQEVQKSIVKRPAQKPKRTRATVRRNPAAIRSSPLRKKKELEIARYKKDIEALRNVGRGRILIMVACGPSIMEVDLPKLKGHPAIDFMVINKPDPRLHPTKYWVFCDQSQYNRNKELFDQFKNTIINAWSVRARHKNQVLIRNKSGKGFSKNLLQGYYIGRSTTFANMQTAHWMGYDKTYIFGCDMCKPPNSKDLHFYGRNEDVDPSIRVKRFQKEAEHYDIGAKQLTPEEREKFVFCSSYNTWSFVKEFGHMDHLIAVDYILEEANQKINQR